MKLFNAHLSPNCMRVRAVVHELALPVEIVDVDMRSGAHRTPEYLAKNPNGKVPLLVDGDLTLWESRAINAYLASKDPSHRLYPEDPKARAIIDQWSFWHAVHLGPTTTKVNFEKIFKAQFKMGEPDENVIANETKEAVKLLKVLDAALAGREWVAGALSIADFALASTLVQRGVDLAELAAVTAWLERVEALPSWKKAMTPNA